MKTFLFLATLLLFHNAFAQTGPEKANCYRAVLSLLHGTPQWRMQPDGYRTPTANFGEWADLKIKNNRVQKLSVVSNSSGSSFTFDKNCHATSKKISPLNYLKKSEGVVYFSDKDLQKAMQQHENGLIYTWSPGMEFSASYYSTFKRAAEKSNLAFIPVVNPEMPLPAIESLMKTYQIPGPIVKMNSVELLMRGSSNHYPKAFLFSKGKVLEKIITGVMGEENLLAQIKSAFSPIENRALASAVVSDCVPAKISVAHHSIAEYIRAEPSGHYVMTCPDNSMIFYDLEKLDANQYATEMTSKFHWETYPVVAGGKWILLANHETLDGGQSFVTSFYDFSGIIKNHEATNVKPLFSDNFESPYLTSATLSDTINSVTKKREVVFRNVILPNGAYRDYRATLNDEGSVTKVELARNNQSASQVLCSDKSTSGQITCPPAQPMISPDGNYYFYTCGEGLGSESFIMKINPVNPKSCELFKHWKFAGEKPTFSFPKEGQASSKYITFANAGLTDTHYPTSVYTLDLEKNPGQIEVAPGDFATITQENEAGDYPNFLADGRILYQHAVEGMTASHGAHGEFITVDPNQLDGDQAHCIRH